MTCNISNDPTKKNSQLQNFESSWTWQMKNALQTQSEFEEHFELTTDEKEAFEKNRNLFQVKATPYYVSLADPKNPSCPIRKILLPHKNELSEYYKNRQYFFDPLNERRNNPVPRIIHRYEDRVLLLVTDFCGVYCRYCTRKHFTASGASMISVKELESALSYIKENSQIKEVIFSGGDPLTLSNERLEFILSEVKKISHIELIRIGTRVPTVLPMRVEQGLIQILKKHKPIFLMSHFNHEKELTLLAQRALEQLVDNGIPVMNQMVLLKGINDNVDAIRALSRALLRCRVKPYYMFQCDPVTGTEHLKVSFEKAKEIQKKLWGHLSGLAMPNLSLDIPGGGGKVGIVPDFYKGSEKGRHFFTGFDGIEGVYEDPVI